MGCDGHVWVGRTEQDRGVGNGMGQWIWMYDIQSVALRHVTKTTSMAYRLGALGSHCIIYITHSRPAFYDAAASNEILQTN